MSSRGARANTGKLTPDPLLMQQMVCWEQVFPRTDESRQVKPTRGLPLSMQQYSVLEDLQTL